MPLPDFGPPRPQHRLIAILTTLALVGLASVAPAQPAADGPLPQVAPRELAARIREARNLYDDHGLFEAAFDEVSDSNSKFMARQGNAEEQKPILVIFSGLVRFASNGVQWRAEHDGKRPNPDSTQLTPDHWITGFDGSNLYDWRVSDRRVVLYETHDNPRLWSPRNLFWDHADELIDLLDSAGQGKILVAIKAEVVEGRACYIVEAGKAGDGGQTRYVISPSQGFLPIRRVQQRNGKPFLTYELRDPREIAPGIWAPSGIEFDMRNVRNDGESRPFIRRSIRVVDYRPQAPVNPAALWFDLPFDVTVTDPRLGYSYFNDPWWPEVKNLLQSQYDWPKTDLSPLGKLPVVSDRTLDGQPAPPLQVARWLQAPPAELAALKGEVVLIVFGDGTSQTRLPLAPAMKTLYATYHAMGLELLVIVPPYANVEAVQQAVEAYEMNFHVGVDSRGPNGFGLSATDYDVDLYPSAVVIDAEGKVRVPEGGRLIPTLLALLAKVNGGRELPRLSLDIPDVPDAALPVVAKRFEEEVSRSLAANPRGEITCRVVDHQGKAIRGAKVTARLGLTVLMVPTGGAFWTTSDRKSPRRDGATDPEGMFVFHGLSKGTYTLKAEAPGHAWVERKVSLGPQLAPASIEFMLQPGLAIAGEVRDEDGELISGATIAAAQWQHTEDTTTFINSCEWLKPATTGADGGFRFVDLPSGLYTFEVQAPGFAKTDLKEIPAGKDNLSIKLKRSE
jgi:hypothetical protein